MVAEFDKQVSQTLEEIKSQGLFKTERVITSPQDAHIAITGGKRVLNMCANNYLGLADHPALIAAAKEALDTHGFGMASVRFICGTQDIHKELEAALTKFLGTEETILYPSCFDANGGLFETLLSEKDAVISDELNHASIIDGIRLCKAQRFRYKHNDMADLEAQLRAAQDARFRLVATDGCFSMDGTIANLSAICDLAEKYNALTMIDDAHATGFLGKTGRGTHEYRGVMGRIDIITGTLGKALGGASGGFTSGRKEIVDLLRQRSRPYLIFQYNRATGCCCFAESARASQRIYRTARQARGKHKVLPRCADRTRPDDQARRASDRPDHDWRRGKITKVRRAHVGERRLRDRFLLSGRSTWHSARAHAGLRRAFARRLGIRGQRVRRSKRRTEVTVEAAVSAAQLRYCGRHARHYRIAMLRAACLLAFCLGRDGGKYFCKRRN